MQTPTFDPGLTQQYTGAVKRVINKDGQMNVHRRGAGWGDFHPYLFMISTSWTTFNVLIIAAFLVLNAVFAGIYCVIGVHHLKGAQTASAGEAFMNAFFFSAHTLTTVGYGNIYPDGVAANLAATLEALIGLLSFAIATGLLFGRFSRPSARIGYSDRMVIAPYQDGTALEFRIVNRRRNNLIELNAQMLLMTVDETSAGLRREFRYLALERKEILFFPLTWTVVHPIDRDSPLFGKTAAELQRLQAEILVMLRGFDETFGQTVHSRMSYRYDEILWGAKFASAISLDNDGALVVEVDHVGLTESKPLVTEVASQ